MNILFDQEYAMERRMISEKIASFVEASQIFGASKEATIREVAKKYNLDEVDAEWHVEASWKELAPA